MQNVNTLCIAAQSPQGTHSTYGIVQRTESDRMANGIRSDGGRNLIGWRTETSGDVPPTDAPTKQTESVPQNTQNTQNILAEKCLPQIGTDAHRLGGYGIPAIPTPPITQPNHLWKSVKSVGEYYHAGAAASAAPTKQTERVSHRIRGTHRTFWQRKPPTDRHRLGGYGIPAIPTPPITQPNHLWKSVKSVGEYYHAGAAASAAPTKQTERVSHRTRGTHRTFWQRSTSHRLHGCAQIRSN